MPAQADARTPLLSDSQGLPTSFASGQVQDHPIFLRVCHSPWTWMSQGGLVYTRAFILLYLTALAPMLVDYKLTKREDLENPWCILFKFSTLTFFLLWIYHLVAFAWSFTHLYYPDIDENDGRWESKILWKMSPPVQTMHSRKRFYFSVFYTAVHVFAFMNVIIYWAVSVPNGHGHFPKGEGEGESVFSAAEDFWSNGWFEPFCLINLWGVTALIAFIEVLILNSIKRQVPVPSHISIITFLLSSYLGWAAFGQLLTEQAAFFWMDPKEVEYTEVITGCCAGFVAFGSVVFAFLYGLIGMRETLTAKDNGQKPNFNAMQEEFQRAMGQPSQGAQ
ncbi:hypothetical protein B0T17DRAFT_504384 [Bombardia bombarda]|uniref:Uncharacterized protein n=1 Tax=Bombardia bombarda TaxID=252184 RepID=A0AA40CGU0_9PEZI|nr:hypothetical protein B0T17DRAFT_504384 [Bombardia bombarda]